MKEKVFLFFKNLFLGNYEQFAFLINVIFLLAINIVIVVVTIFSKTNKNKKLITFSVYYLLLSILPFIYLKKQKAETIILFLMVGVLVIVPLFLLSKKQKIKTPSEIIKIIDKAVKDTSFSDINLPIKKVETQNEEIENLQKNSNTLPDFNHVKNIIERLEEYPLTLADKKQIKDLENRIILIENSGAENYEINDELCAIIKMMAKYGV